MSVPVSERARARSAVIPAQRRAGVPAQRAAGAPPQRGAGVPARWAATVPAQRAGGPVREVAVPTQRAAERAYARRDARVRRAGGPRAARPAAGAGRPQFVLLVMVLLGTGLVATLWLSTAAAADSYRLQDARLEARVLAEQSARLHRDVASMAAAPALAERARGLGMVAVQDPARLVVAEDGTVEVVGDPLPAQAPPPPVVAPPAGDAAAGEASG
ncbi:MAG TPA: hypothetical protein VM367_14395, partial [Pseudonocardia sp.]|nr:hypothetical protein [Pseudonocardia sp.]